MMDLTMNFDTDECLVTAMFDKGNRNDTMEAIDHIIPFLKGDADMIRLVCNTLRKLLCMSDEGYETFLIDLEDYKSEFVERFPELSLFFKAYSLLDSEMICIFPYFCPCEESAREIREFFIKHCSLLYQEVLRNPVLLFLLSERKYSLWY